VVNIDKPILSLWVYSCMHQFTHQQTVAATQQEVWNFFSDPANLLRLTPPKMNMELAEKPQLPIYAGQLVHLKVKPFPGLKQKWISEISALEAPNYFIDKMLSGPFALWHHQHRFKSHEGGGTLILDVVHYRLPLWPLSELFHPWLVKKELQDLFAFRRKQIEKHFGTT